MTAPAARRRRRPLTNTNTDDLCATEHSVIGKWIYRFNLWTGLYMLNPYERFIFHVVGWFAFVVSMLYLYVFWKGFVEGFQQQQLEQQGQLHFDTPSVTTATLLADSTMEL